MSASFHHYSSCYAIKKQHMALCCCIFNSAFLCKLPSSSSTTSTEFISPNGSHSTTKGPSFSKIGVVSSHSNPRILKSKHRSRYGQQLSPYDSDEEEENEDVDEQHNDSDDWFSDDDFGDQNSDVNKKLSQFHNASQTKQGRHRDFRKELEVRSLNSRKTLERNGKSVLYKRSIGGYRNTSKEFVSAGSLALHGKEKEAGNGTKNRYRRLSEELYLDEGCFPLLDYLSTFGLKDSHFIQIYERHMPSLQINVASAQERLEFLLSVGVKQRDILKIILRQPQILEYTVENNLKSHVAFLSSLDIPDSKIGQIITAAPSIFSYSVDNSLKPTVRYLLEEVGIQKSDLSKVVQLSPQILVQRIDSSWNTRLKFLTKELGAPRESIVKMVTKHPQLLHYSIEDGLLPRINFLRSIGLCNAEILKVSTSLTQVLSLSLEGNLKPKYMYLINELQNEVHSLTKYPMYLSLSLDQRIRPRHRFLVSLKKAPRGPFPLSSFVPTDECFCQQWAGTSLDKYLDFRQKLLVKELAKKYKR